MAGHIGDDTNSFYTAKFTREEPTKRCCDIECITDHRCLLFATHKQHLEEGTNQHREVSKQRKVYKWNVVIVDATFRVSFSFEEEPLVDVAVYRSARHSVYLYGVCNKALHQKLVILLGLLLNADTLDFNIFTIFLGRASAVNVDYLHLFTLFHSPFYCF